MPRFTKKPVVIEAIQWNGQNFEEIEGFIGKELVYADGYKKQIAIPTLEGLMKASVNDWIIKGINGEFYPCKPDIFKKTYEPA